MKKPLTIFLILLSCLIVFVFIVSPFTPKRHGRGCGHMSNEGFKLQIPVSGEIDFDLSDKSNSLISFLNSKTDNSTDTGNVQTDSGNAITYGAKNGNSFDIDEKLLNYLMTYNPSYQWQGPSAMDDYIMKTQIVPPVCPTCMQCANGVQGGGVCNNCGGNGGNGNSGTAATTAATPASTPAATSTSAPDVKDEHTIRDAAKIVGSDVRGAAHTVGGDVRGAVKTIGGDVKQTVDTIGSTIGSFFNTLGSMAHNTVSTVGGDLNTVKNTIGSDINTVKNTIGSDINTVKNTIGRDIHGIAHTIGSDVHGTSHIIGKDIHTVVNTVGEELLDIPKGIGSLFDSDEEKRHYQSSTSTSAPTSAPTPAPTPAPTSAPTPAPTSAPTPATQPAPTSATQPAKTPAPAQNIGNTCQQPIRSGIPSPSGVYFNGMDPKLFGNQPGALGGPKMDPYSYFGTVPAKGWTNEPQPLGADFSSFGR